MTQGSALQHFCWQQLFFWQQFFLAPHLVGAGVAHFTGGLAHFAGCGVQHGFLVPQRFEQLQGFEQPQGFAQPQRFGQQLCGARQVLQQGGLMVETLRWYVWTVGQHGRLTVGAQHLG